MKKLPLLIILLFYPLALSIALDFKPGYEFGLGSGYVFYGDEEAKDLIDAIDNDHRSIVCANAAFLLGVNEYVKFALGGDSLLDSYWKGGEYVHLFDYCGTLGFRIFPALAGLNIGVDYCLGRRTDFYDFKGVKADHRSSSWGNGFKFSLGYDFGWDNFGFAPHIGAFVRRMPRGNHDADTVLGVTVKISRK